MIISIASGKGGTGKTSLTAAFAGLAVNSVLGDADVDAADLHLLMAPEVQQRTDFMDDGERQEIRSMVLDMIAGKFVFSSAANAEGHW